MLHLSQPLEVILLSSKAEGVLQHGQELSSVNLMLLFLFCTFFLFSIFDVSMFYLVI